MTITNHFYHSLTRKYIALFGSQFNKMKITRTEGDAVQNILIPITYAPVQKWLARIQDDPTFDRKQAITLPRMSFELESISYDGTRKIPNMTKIRKSTMADADSPIDYAYSPAPYNINFNLYIMAKYAEDGTKIVEQILPDFKPNHTFTVELIKDLPSMDIPLVLNSVSMEDTYEANFESRRMVLWTLSFVMKAWYFGPVRERKVIKFIDVRLHDSISANSTPIEKITIQPGLTAQGNPTTDIDETIPYEEIKIDDDWGVITIIEEYTE